MSPDGDYTISGWDDSYANGRQRNAGFFKVPSNISLPLVVVPKMHTVMRNQTYLGQKHFVDNNGYLYMAPTVNKPFSPGGTPMDATRLVKIDPTLTFELCPVDDLDLFAKTEFGYLPIPYDEIRIDPEYSNYDFLYEETRLTHDNCDKTQTYRLSGKAIYKGETISIKPTVISNQSDKVRCTIETFEEGFVDVITYSSLGNVLSRQKVAIATGSNSFELESNFSIGMNLVKVMTRNNTTTYKIIVR